MGVEEGFWPNKSAPKSGGEFAEIGHEEVGNDHHLAGYMRAEDAGKDGPTAGYLVSVIKVETESTEEATSRAMEFGKAVEKLCEEHDFEIVTDFGEMTTAVHGMLMAQAQAHGIQIPDELK